MWNKEALTTWATFKLWNQPTYGRVLQLWQSCLPLQVMDKAYKCSPAGVQYTALPGLSVGSHPPTVVSTTSPLTTSCGATTVSTHPQVHMKTPDCAAYSCYLSLAA